jgi:hypothetical protein
MRHSCRSITALVAAAFMAAYAEAQPAQPGSAPGLQARVGSGTIRGTVRDTMGGALEGVLVSALGAMSTVAVTDTTGRYAFPSLPPGPYLLRAHLPGFVASPRELVQVLPNTQLVRAIALRRIGAVIGEGDTPETLAAGLAGGEANPVAGGGDHAHTPTAWRLRHVQRSVLRDVNGVPLEEDKAPEPQSAWAPGSWLGAVASSARLASALFADSSVSGEVNLLTTGAFDNTQDLFSVARVPRGVAYLSIGAPVGLGAWSVRAAVTGGEISSWIVAGAYKGQARQGHLLNLGVSYGAQQYEQANPLTIASIAETNRNVGAVHGFDNWALSRQVEVSYGAQWARYDYLDRENLLSPQVGVSVSPMRQTYIRASVSQQMVVPGAEEFLPPSAGGGPWLPPERTFAPLVGDRFRAERVRNFEVSVEREFDATYVIGIRRFYQQSDDQLVTLFGVDTASADLGHYVVASSGAVSAHGWGVRLSSPLISRLRGSVDYSLTRARWAPSLENGIIEAVAPSAARSENESFHDVTTSLEAAIPETATRVSFVYKINSAYSRSEGDATLPGFDGRFDVRVNQSLPFMKFVSSEWEVLLAIRSLFREPLTGGSVYDELLVVRPPKRVVGGFLVRF